VKTTLSSEC